MKANEVSKYLAYSEEDVIVISREKWETILKIIHKYRKVKKILDNLKEV